MGSKANKTKKRNKKYAGADAKRSTNVVRVRKVSAVVRSDWQQWIHDHKKLIKYTLIAVLIIALIVASFVIKVK